MSPTTPPQDPQPGVSWMPDDAGSRLAGRAGNTSPQLASVPGEAGGETGAVTGRGAAMTEAGLAAADPPAGPGGAGADDSAQGTAPPVGVEVLERLSQRLTMAGLRLASLRRRLAGVEDRMMLIQASDDLDEAIAEVRRLALKVSARMQP